MKAKHLTAILLLVFGFSSCKDTDRPTKFDEEVQEEFTSTMEDVRAANQKEMDETGEISTEQDLENQKKLIEAVKKMERNATGDQAKLASVQREFFEAIIENNNKLQEFAEELMEDLDLSKMKSVADIDTGLQAIEKGKKLNQDSVDFFTKGLSPLIGELLDKYEVKGRLRSEFLAGMNNGLKKKMPYRVEVHEYDVKILDELSSLLNLMKENHGKWVWDDENGMVQFDEDLGDSVLGKVEDIYTNVADLTEKQLVAEKKARGLK